MADDFGAAAGGGCCAAILGAFWQYFGLKSWGANWTCCDKICRCECCWDNGEFDPDNMPGAGMHDRQRPGAANKPVDQDTQRAVDKGEEDLPAYRAADPMTVPDSAVSGQPAADAAPAANGRPTPLPSEGQNAVNTAGVAASSQTGVP